MPIGEILAGARQRAGLTVAQVSERTCIREAVIEGIEGGDYSACGGDFTPGEHPKHRQGRRGRFRSADPGV